MKNVVAIVEDEKGQEQVFFECPGCKCGHSVYINRSERPAWQFNNDLKRPTLSPSILVRWVSTPKNWEVDEKGEYILGSDGRIKGAREMICHSFVNNGQIRFLNDCTHKLKGQTVDLLEI